MELGRILGFIGSSWVIVVNVSYHVRQITHNKRTHLTLDGGFSSPPRARGGAGGGVLLVVSVIKRTS